MLLIDRTTDMRPAAVQEVSVMTPICRVMEPALADPIKRPTQDLVPQFGCVLLLEPGQTPGIWGAITEAATAWRRGIWLLRHNCILHPLGKLPDDQAVKLGAEYVDGYYLRVRCPQPPLVTDVGGDEIPASRVRSGSLVECALTFTAKVIDGQRSTPALLEWVTVHDASPIDRWSWKPLED